VLHSRDRYIAHAGGEIKERRISQRSMSFCILKRCRRSPR